MQKRKDTGRDAPGSLAWFEQRFAELKPADGERMSRFNAAGEYIDDEVDRELMRMIDERGKLPLAQRGPMPKRADAERSLAEQKRGAA